MKKLVRRGRHWWYKTPNDQIAYAFLGIGAALLFIALIGVVTVG